MQISIALKNLDSDYYSLIEDLIHNDDVLRLADITHHHFTNRLEHSITVSYLSYRLAKQWKLDARASARAGLLHDFFHEDRDQMARLGGGSHATLHPKIAVQNASQITELSALEIDIILKHMFLVSKCWLPKYRESYLVSMVDKYVALKEVTVPILSMMRTGVKRGVLKFLPF